MHITQVQIVQISLCYCHLHLLVVMHLIQLTSLKLLQLSDFPLEWLFSMLSLVAADIFLMEMATDENVPCLIMMGSSASCQGDQAHSTKHQACKDDLTANRALFQVLLKHAIPWYQ